VTAVDASPEMLELARHRVGNDPRVRFVLADLFAWRPEGRYDVVFFGFWIDDTSESDVPPRASASSSSVAPNRSCPARPRAPRAPGSGCATEGGGTQNTTGDVLPRPVRGRFHTADRPAPDAVSGKRGPEW